MTESSGAPGPPEPRGGAYHGKYRGTVIDNHDPHGLGRLRAHVPGALGDVESGWALPCAPYAGHGTGFHAVPPAGAGVWIEFEEGDLSRPIWSGCWWRPGELPQDAGGAPAGSSLKILRSEAGLVLALDDFAQTIALSDAEGRSLVTINAQRGVVKVQAAAKVVVEAPVVELGENAGHAVVLGDRLLQYLNQCVQLYQSHTHPGQLALGVVPVTSAPPVPPMPPATPALLSTKVQTG